MGQRVSLFMGVYTLTFVIATAFTQHMPLLNVVVLTLAVTISLGVYLIRGYTRRYDIFTWFLMVLLAVLTALFLRLLFIVVGLKLSGVI